MFVKKEDTKPLSFQANVCNTGVDGSPGIQTQLSGVTSALKKIVTDPGIMTGSLTVKDDARVMVIKSQKTVAGESHIVFKVMSLYDCIENCGSWGQQHYEKLNPKAKLDFKYFSLAEAQQLFSVDYPASFSPPRRRTSGKVKGRIAPTKTPPRVYV